MKHESNNTQQTEAMPYDALLAVRLIANFMGWVDSPFDNTPNKLYSKDLKNGRHISHFKYSESWDALMPVYRKIRDIINERAKYDKHTRTKADLLELDVQMAICAVDINKAFKATAEFAKWWKASLADR